MKAPRCGEPWTTDERVVLLNHKGSNSEVADILGRTATAVAAQRSKWGLTVCKTGDWRGKRIPTAAEHVKGVTNPFERIRKLQQRYYEVRECRIRALEVIGPNAAFHATERRLWDILQDVRYELDHAKRSSGEVYTLEP